MKKGLDSFAMDAAAADQDRFEQVSFDCGSSVDGLSSSEALSLSLRSDEPGGDHPPVDEEENEDSSSLEGGGGAAAAAGGGGGEEGEEGEAGEAGEEGEGEHCWSSTELDIDRSNTDKKSKGFFFQGAPLPPASKAISQTRKKPELSEIEMMKEKFSKLLLGEDMSGGGKGVCSALAISNSIINLSASVFGELWRLEPLPLEKKAMWRREMDWLLSVADHIVELVPSRHSLPNGGSIEVMVTRPRSDIHVNLPALRKLDGMLLETLDTFDATEFWYVDQGIAVAEDNNPTTLQRAVQHRRDDKWWLPIPKVPNEGLSKECTKQLQHQRESINQILKAAVAINSQILSEMEIPELYFDALPKNGKASLGEDLHRYLTSESFNPDAILDMMDLSSEHRAVDTANRIEAAIHVWRRRQRGRHHSRASKESKQQQHHHHHHHHHQHQHQHQQQQQQQGMARSSWGLVKDFVLDSDRRECFAGRAENLLLCLKQRFPNLRQTLLDITKIQHNKDVGRAVLESYARVLESLAFNIASRIEDVLYAGEMVRRSLPHPAAASLCSPPNHRHYHHYHHHHHHDHHVFIKPRALSLGARRRACGGHSSNIVFHTPYGTPLVTPSASPTPSSSPRRTPNSPLQSENDDDDGDDDDDDDDDETRPQLPPLPDYMVGYAYAFERAFESGLPSKDLRKNSKSLGSFRNA